MKSLKCYSMFMHEMDLSEKAKCLSKVIQKHPDWQILNVESQDSLMIVWYLKDTEPPIDTTSHEKILAYLDSVWIVWYDGQNGNVDKEGNLRPAELWGVYPSKEMAKEVLTYYPKIPLRINQFLLGAR
jgi:hypothetical protein